VIATPAEVREKFRRVKPLKDISVTQHGWTVAAFGRKPPYSLRRSAETPLRCRLVSEGRAPRDPNFSGQSGKMGRRGTPPSDSFTTAVAYAFTRELERLHPDNPVNKGTGQESASNYKCCAMLVFCFTSNAAFGVCHEFGRADAVQAGLPPPSVVFLRAGQKTNSTHQSI